MVTNILLVTVATFLLMEAFVYVGAARRLGWAWPVRALKAYFRR